LFVVRLCSALVSVFEIVTVALGTAAPVGSVIVPRMVPSWANAGVANRTRRKRVKTRRNPGILRARPPTERPELPAHVGERVFISCLRFALGRYDFLQGETPAVNANA
jgi:hypothetical protein